MADYRGVMIGCGGRAGGHAEAYVRASGVEMVAVADMDEAKADAFAQKYGVTRYYDAEEMLDKESPDIVTVCTREEPRCALTIAAAERGAGMFLYILGVLSVNLGVVNLLPIPVLDGGHLLFAAVEKVRGRPVGEKIRAVASYVGLSLLIGIMLLAFWNDIWGLIK